MALRHFKGIHGILRPTFLSGLCYLCHLHPDTFPASSPTLLLLSYCKLPRGIAKLLGDRRVATVIPYLCRVLGGCPTQYPILELYLSPGAPPFDLSVSVLSQSSGLSTWTQASSTLWNFLSLFKWADFSQLEWDVMTWAGHSVQLLQASFYINYHLFVFSSDWTVLFESRDYLFHSVLPRLSTPPGTE